MILAVAKSSQIYTFYLIKKRERKKNGNKTEKKERNGKKTRAEWKKERNINYMDSGES